DSKDENDETFTVTLSDAQNAANGTMSVSGTITDNDLPPSLSIGNVTVTEGDTASVTVTLSGASSFPVTFDWTTSDGSAEEPGDYTAGSGTAVTIAAGDTSATLSVVTIDDALDEAAEAFDVLISNPSHATISDNTGVVTVNDNDGAPSISIVD